MFSIILTLLVASGIFPSMMESPSVSVGRMSDGGNFVEICSGVAVSPSHAVTLFAFTKENDVFIIQNGGRFTPDSVINFRDMGLSMLVFQDDLFETFEQPRNTFPETGAALMIMADHPTGLSVIRTFPMEQLSDGAFLLASPPASELMGAPVFDAYDRLSGIVTGSFNPGDDRGELMALIPCNLWYYWVETLLTDAGLNTPLFGVTAMPATSGLSSVQGILLLHVDENSIAGTSGLQEGDIITEVEGERVYHPEALKMMVQSNTSELILTVSRDSETMFITIQAF